MSLLGDFELVPQVSSTFRVDSIELEKEPQPHECATNFYDLWREPDCPPQIRYCDLNELPESYSLLALRMRMDGFEGNTQVRYWHTEKKLKEAQVQGWVYRSQVGKWDKRRIYA